MSNTQRKVIRGQDDLLEIKASFDTPSLDPYPLTGWTKITVQFRKSDRTLLEKTTDLQGGAMATALFETVNYTASNYGVAGNSISLVFNGSDNIATVIGDWNTANPTNMATSDAADDLVVPTAATVSLVGGVDQVRDVNVLDEILSKMTVDLTDLDTNSLKTGPNQSFRVYIDKGESRKIILFDSAINVINADI